MRPPGWRIHAHSPQCVVGWGVCVPWSWGFLSLRLKFFHQLAKSFLSLIDSVCTGCEAALGPPAPGGAVEGPLVVMPGDGPGGVVTPGYCMRGARGVDGECGRNTAAAAAAVVGRSWGWGGGWVSVRRQYGDDCSSVVVVAVAMRTR